MLVRIITPVQATTKRMILKSHYFRMLFSLALLISYMSAFTQKADFLKVTNSKFPDSWDKNRDLRGRNGKILAWTYIKYDRKNEGKSCITLVSGTDTTGNNVYFISEMFTNQKPFNKWNHSWTHRLPSKPDSTSGLLIGFLYTHLRRFDHKPTEDELYSILNEWNFTFFKKGSKTVEAGIDETLWLDAFGFIPDWKKLSKIE